MKLFLLLRKDAAIEEILNCCSNLLKKLRRVKEMKDPYPICYEYDKQITSKDMLECLLGKRIFNVYHREDVNKWEESSNNGETMLYSVNAVTGPSHTPAIGVTDNFIYISEEVIRDHRRDKLKQGRRKRVENLHTGRWRKNFETGIAAQH